MAFICPYCGMAAQVIAVKLEQIEGVQEHASVLAAIARV
jgi:hypothetical protein